VSESGFTSEQRKKVIYGREKHRKKGEIRVEKKESKGEKNRKVKEKNRLCCYFV